MIKPISSSVAVAAIMSFAACDEAFAIEISRAEYDERWPFTVPSGRLECVAPSKVVFYANGVAYAVNGMASGDRRYRDIRPIWKDNPAITGTKIDISPILDRGLDLCD